MSDKLKPCPFCGGKAYLYTIHTVRGLKFRIMCGASVECCCILYDFDTEEEAANFWDRRN